MASLLYSWPTSLLPPGSFDKQERTVDINAVF